MQLQVIFAPYQWNDLRVAHRAFLHLASPLEPNTTSSLVATRLNTTWNNGSISLPFAFDPTALNTNIRVNQIGFLPSHPKRAWLGQFAGADGSGTNVGVEFFGGSGASTSREFDVLDATTNEVVAKGTASPAGGASFNLTGQDLWTLDLSEVQTEGWYRVRVPSVGVSHSFQVGSRVFDQVRPVLVGSLDNALE